MIFLGHEIGNWKTPFIVAEISGNHGGSFNRAIQLIEAAKQAKADAVKIQCYDADDLTLDNGYVIEEGSPWAGEKLHDLYKKASTPHDWIEPLFEHARKIQIPIFSSVYSKAGLSTLKAVNCPAYKIASYEASDIDFIKEVHSRGKPVVISLGATGYDDLIRIRKWLTEAEMERTVFLHCVAKYPLEFYELGLQDIQNLQMEVTQPVGFSCHSNDPMAVVLAGAVGAAMIEVHLNLGDEGDSETEDFEFSFSPWHLKYAIEHAKDTKAALSFKRTSLETAARKFKRSLFVTKDMKAGDIFTSENVGSYRPALGLEPWRIYDVIGKKASCDITAGTPMTMEHVS